MMSDLTERLRRFANYHSLDFDSKDQPTAKAFVDAVDEIERLQAELKQANAERKNWYCELCGCSNCLAAEDRAALETADGT